MGGSMAKKTWTSKTTGRTLTLKPVPQRYVAELKERPDLRLPEKPTYTVQAAGDVELTFPHDETTLVTSEHKAAWAKYKEQDALQKYRTEMEIARFLFYNVIEDNPDPPDSWSFDFDLWGLSPPDTSDPIEFKVRWLEEEICGGSTDDTAELLLECYAQAGMRNEFIRQVESFFRFALEGALSLNPDHR